MPIHEWPETTRPRERLVARGASSLSDDELLALLIGSGTAERSALVIANEMLRAIAGTRAVGQVDVAGSAFSGCRQRAWRLPRLDEPVAER